jgi:ferredoxin-NADP reductase
VSTALHTTVRPGSTLHARPPAGRFVYPAEDDRPLVLLAAGVGITPLMSMVRHGVVIDPQRPITLVQAARRRDGLAFADELRVLERRYPQFRWVPAVTGGDAGPECYPGRIDDTLLRAAVPDIARAIVAVCGPEPMIAGTRETLAALNVPGGQVRYELFEAVVAATGVQRADPEAGEAGESTVVTFLRSAVQQPARRGQTLLDAAEAGGVSIPTMCRAGVCGTCRTRVVRGEVQCPSDALGADDSEAGFVLACVSAIATDCSVEA